jgi:cell division septal protein FtsQ
MTKRKGVNSRKRYVRMRQERARKIRKTAPVVLVVLLIAGALAGVTYSGMIGYEKIAAAVSSSKLFTVKNVMVKGNERVSVAEVLDKCGISTVSKMYKVNTAAVAANLAGNPWIEQVRCVKKWWGSVVIEIRERTPIALVTAGNVMLVDGSGTVIPIEPGKDYKLPMLIGARVVADDNGRRHIDSGTIARVNRFITTVRATDASLFDIIPQFDVTDRGVVRGFAVSPKTMVEIGYDTDFSQLKNLRYLLDALVARHEAPERINAQYRNLAFVRTDENNDVMHVD